MNDTDEIVIEKENEEEEINNDSENGNRSLIKLNRTALAFLLLPLWFFIYIKLEAISDFLVYSVFGMTKGTHLTGAVSFFIFEVPKVLMLLILIVFAVGIVRSYFSPERTRKMIGELSKELAVVAILGTAVAVFVVQLALRAMPALNSSAPVFLF
jgi:uncharacterized membrane protein YraQ (UPF0718 family)